MGVDGFQQMFSIIGNRQKYLPIPLLLAFNSLIPVLLLHFWLINIFKMPMGLLVLVVCNFIKKCPDSTRFHGEPRAIEILKKSIFSLTALKYNSIKGAYNRLSSTNLRFCSLNSKKKTKVS